MTQNNNIPQGYKESPLGIIPKEWEVKRFYEILLEARLGGNYENSESNNGVPVIKMGNLERGTINLDKIQCLPKNELHSEYDILQENDLLFNTRNTLELVGKVSIWKNDLPLAVYNSNLLRITFKDKYVASNIFMNYAFNSHYILSQLRGIATGTTSVAAIYNRDLDTIKFFLPSFPEQQKIAEILSVWDEAIEKQTQLITQLETRKRGLMQQLLTGKKRVKGFSGKWNKMKLGELFSERSESNCTHLQLLSVGQNGVYPQTESDKRDTSNEDKSKYKRICKGDIGYNTMRLWQGRCALSELEGIISPAYTVVIPNNKSKGDFFAYFFKMPHIIYCFWTHSQGLVSDTLNCKYPNFASIQVLVPHIEEQTAIANILSDADSEIDLAKKKLASLKEQKKGLMQQLLTGKKRVKI